MKKIVTFCIFLFIAGSIKSQAYYVDVTNGNDTFSGSMIQPWQRLDTAINRLSAGDTLFVRAGDYTYLGQIIVQKNGTSAQPVVISGYQNEYPLVQGFTIAYSSWLTIEKIDFKGPEQIPAGWSDMDTVVIDNPSITIDPLEAWDTPPYRIDSVLTKYTTYANFFNYGWIAVPTWESNNSNGLNILNCTNIQLLNNKIHHHTYGVRLKNESKNIAIMNNEIHHCLDAISAFCATPTYIYSFGYSTISNNTIYQSFRNGIMLNYGAHHSVIDNNFITFTGQNHISTYNLDILSDSAGYNTISNNTLAYGGYYAEFMKYPGPSGISLHSPGPNCMAVGNFIAYHFSNARVGNNLVDGNGMISDNNPNGSDFINNVCYRNMGNGITIIKSKNNKIIHNTILESGYNDVTSVTSGVGISIIEAADSLNIISNNILYNSSRGGILAKSGNLSSQEYIDNNLYYFISGAPYAGDLPALYYSTPYLSFENNAIAADPFIMDSLGHLASGSPALLAGGNLYSYPTDKDGISRNNLTPSVGAYENSITTGVVEPVSSNTNFKVFPNPVNNILIVEAIDIGNPGEENFCIYDISGRLIISETFNSSKMNYLRLNSFSPGVYVYTYGSYSGRLVKQ